MTATPRPKKPLLAARDTSPSSVLGTLQLGSATAHIVHGVEAGQVNLILALPMRITPRPTASSGDAVKLNPPGDESHDWTYQPIGAEALRSQVLIRNADMIKGELIRVIDSDMVKEYIGEITPQNPPTNLIEPGPDMAQPRSPAKVRISHFTRGILGPENANRFAEPLDFDLNVLWVASWFRRDEDDRRRLIDLLASSEEFQKAFGDKEGALEWLTAMEDSLSKVADYGSTMHSDAMSLAEITQLIRYWNSSRDALRDQNGIAPLDQIDTVRNRTLVDASIELLLEDKSGNGTVFTDSDAAHQEWTVLNLLRYWSVLGRESAPELRNYWPIMTPRSLDKYIKYHP